MSVINSWMKISSLCLTIELGTHLDITPFHNELIKQSILKFELGSDLTFMLLMGYKVRCTLPHQ